MIPITKTIKQWETYYQKLVAIKQPSDDIVEIMSTIEDAVGSVTPESDSDTLIICFTQQQADIISRNQWDHNLLVVQNWSTAPDETDLKGEYTMDFNKDKLGDILEVINGFKKHKITLINDHKARTEDIEYFIKAIIDKDINYTYTSDGTILYLDTKED